MSTAEATVEKPAKEIKVTQSDFDKMVNERVQKLFAEMGISMFKQQQTGEGPKVFKTVDTIEDGEIVPPGWSPPEGWQCIIYRDGTQRAHRKGKKNYDREIRTKTLNKVTDAYKAWFIKTPERPNPEPPKRLLVNAAWRQLFKAVKMWGDHTDIEKVSSEAFKDAEGKVLEGPQFRFVNTEDGE